jgi:hypothetical protein
MEIGISVCAACKATLKLEELVNSELELVAIAALRKMKPDALTPDLSRTRLEWMPCEESDLPPAKPSEGGGPVAEHFFISDDKSEIATARRCYAETLKVLAPGDVDLAGLQPLFRDPGNLPKYECAQCGGQFLHPILGGDRVGVVVFQIENGHVKAVLLHAGCWRPRCRKVAT